MNDLSSITLHSYWRSSSAWRVRIALELKGLAYTLVTVNLKPGVDEQRSDAFQNLNRLGQIPVVEALLDGQALRLTQSLAILALLEQVAPSPALYPARPSERAWALEAAELINSGMQPLQNIGTQTQIEALGGDAAEFSRGFVTRGLGALEAYASQRGGAYSVGDALSVADVLLVPQLYAARRLHIELERYPKLLEIEQRCAELPAFGKAHARSQPDCPDAAHTRSG